MFILICIIVLTYSIQLPIKESENIEVLELGSSDQLQEQQLKKVQNNQQVFLLEIANYLEGTTINSLLGLQSKDNQSKRIIIATILSIMLIVIFCVVIQLILDVSKKCRIKLSRESTSLPIS
ncbi:unnamed protein product (macronuclear) [Paramecium tetraurelia]|uniref:Transmembrane protein n=1 Tax=Paramecium tetraurelia TaxID=5888 RepID=A0E6W3_PARTE|nr:uncharacterized protein GSPATT00023758001 [Paramecium tetraurelia]CAK91030.1 unnamed protein product [Paramecium tetraurelia]|eukprot:XP_001458427.1 hypothetical protein (macronuclear) [Paramecium tetraurelia strain d4-2]